MSDRKPASERLRESLAKLATDWQAKAAGLDADSDIDAAAADAYRECAEALAEVLK